MATLADLSPADRAEADRILAMPQGTEAERIASVRLWHAFLDRHNVECVSVFSDDFGAMFLRDKRGTVTPCIEEFRP